MATVINHVGICVSDLERSRLFYQEVLGFELLREVDAPDEVTTKLADLAPPVGLKAVFLERDGFVLEVLYFAAAGANVPPRPRVMNDLGLTHISFSVDDVEVTVAKAVEHGGRVLENTQIDIGFGNSIMICDPDGQRLELFPMAYRTFLPD
jgi:catechol 2,3-dioxygenase-like lactoylglutathione lyase family enzyme